MNKYRINPLTAGDIIRTHPARGFWGCAIVLSTFPGTAQFWPQCHIATTTLIRRKKFQWADVDIAALKIARLKVVMRVDINDYRELPDPVTCIGIFSLKDAENLDIIGRIDPKTIYPQRLTTQLGDGTGRTFPHMGVVDEQLGSEAVTLWRETHDAERLTREEQRDRRQFERLEAERLAKERAARKKRAEAKTKTGAKATARRRGG